MTALVRIAIAGAWRSGAADRARSLLVVGCVAMLSVVSSSLIAAGNAHTRAVERVTSRGYAPAPDDEQPAYLRSVLFDVAPDGSQIVVVTWKIVDRSPTPRGFPEDAKPDVFYLSPALANLAKTSAIVRDRFPRAQALDAQYVGQANELLAYRLTLDPAGLTETLVDRGGVDAVGEVTLPSAESTIAPAILLLVLPGIGLVWAAASIPATRLRRRLELLHDLGASPTSVRLVTLVQALAVVLPGAGIGAGLWALVSPHFAHIPLTDLAVLPGDLTLTVSQTAALAAVLILVYSVTLARSSLIQRRSRRRTSDLLPMIGVGTAAMLFAPVVGGKNGFALLLGGVGAVVAGAPAMVAQVYGFAGRRLIIMRKWQTVLVGRQLTTASRGMARSQIAWLAFLIVVPLAASWIATVRLADTQPESPISVVQARSDSAVEIRAWLETQLNAPSIQVAVESLTLDDLREPRLLLIADCDDLRDVLEITCSSDGGFTLPPELQVLSRFDPEASPAVPAGFDLDESLLLFIDTNGGDLENALRALAVSTPGLSVGSQLASRQRESPLVSFVLGTLTAMAIVTALALVLVIAGQSARSARARRRLLILGASKRSIAAVAALEATGVVGLAAIATTPLTAFALWSMRRLEETTVVQSTTLLWIAAAMAGGTAIAAIAAAVATRTTDSPQE